MGWCARVVESHRLPVAEVVAETADAVTVVFAVPPALTERYAYRPGQFLTLRIPADEGGLARCYSLSSSPHPANPGQRIAVTVKRVADGRGSNWLCDHAAPGLELDTLPPAGTFTPRSLDTDLLLVAAGSGITPVMSILRTALATGTGRLTLCYANEHERSVIFADQLRRLTAAHPDRLSVVHWLTSLQGLPTSAGLAALLAPYADREVFLCGPAAFMAAVTHGLRELSVPRARIHIERFASLTEDPFGPADQTTPPTTSPTGPAETAAASVEVLLDGARHRLGWPADTVLLDALRANGLAAPHSCREGACGACAVRVTSGEVRMRRNEVLDQTDLAEGYALACQALPVTESVSVSYE
jgi:3-ketosteroid 9alpha-monooxygenase subunit B